MNPTEATDTTGTRETPCKGCGQGRAWGPLIDGIAEANRNSALNSRDIRRLQVAILFAVCVVVGLYVRKGVQA